MLDLAKLLEPFPKELVSWRAQHLTAGGDKALALAYIDARDVMNRLDDVCGGDGWQCEYPHAGSKTICSIGIKCGEEWVWKADGAGDTDIEAEKGAISDAFKRAAVKWGIGRYLYDLEAVWVPCDSYKKGEKFAWKAWKEDPWKYVKASQKAGFPSARQQNARWVEIKDSMISAETEIELGEIWQRSQAELIVFKRADPEMFAELEQVKNTRKSEIQQEAAMRNGMSQGFNEVRA